MELSRKTWHYGVWVSTFKGNVPTDTGICPYFWTVCREIVRRNWDITKFACGLLFGIVFVVCLFGAAFGVVYLALFKGIPASASIFSGHGNSADGWSAPLGFVLLLFGTLIGVIVLYARLVHRHVVSTLILGWEVIKAKLGRYCPPVTFKD